jgi:hypothetical protein
MTERLFFLTNDEMRQLTGRTLKKLQIQWLKDQAIPFRVSVTGYPVVVRAVIEGRKEPTLPQPRRTWTPELAEA